MGNPSFKASIAEQIFEPIWSRTDWVETAELFDEATNEALTDLNNCTAHIEIRSNGSSKPALTGSLDDGHISFRPDGKIQWHFTAQEIGSLSPGIHEVGFTFARDGITQLELTRSLPIVDEAMR